MAMPKVSIITLTYNHEKYIAQCVQSVLDQTYGEWELIIVDDGSVDRTEQIIRGKNDPRITYIRTEHRGPGFLGENYNLALAKSQGELLVILEGDDYIPPDRLTVQVPSFANDDIVLSHGKYAHLCNNQVTVYPIPADGDVLRNRPVGSALKSLLLGFPFIATQSVMIRKSALVAAGGFTQPRYLPLVDYPTWMNLALQGRFDFLPRVLGYWRRHAESITFNESERIFNGFLQYCDEFVVSFKQELTALGMKKYIDNRGAIAYLSLAVIKMSSRDWNSAWMFAKECWRRKTALDWHFRVRLLFALAGILLHCNVAALAGRIRTLLYKYKAAGR